MQKNEDLNTAGLQRPLRPGCHVLGFVPINPPLGKRSLEPLVGTLRVVDEGGVTFSGDLYKTGSTYAWDSPDDGGDGGDFPCEEEKIIVSHPDADSRDGVPVFPLKAYDSYIRGLSAKQDAATGDVEVVFECYGFSVGKNGFNDGTWGLNGSFTCRLEHTAATLASPSPDDDWVGLVRDASGSAVALMTITWADAFLRRARLMIGVEDGAEVALNNGLGADWESVFRDVGWNVTFGEQVGIPSTASGLWTEVSLHEAMVTHIDVNHDFEWAYRMLCVKKFDPGEIRRDTLGTMFDRRRDDLNRIPREGFALSADFVLPSSYGEVAGKRAGEATGVFFRAAVHEIGHCLGMQHEDDTPYFASTTPNVARLATGQVPFPENIAYSFSPESRRRLQHAPDPEVRPGGPYRVERPSDSYFGLPRLPLTTRADS